MSLFKDKFDKYIADMPKYSEIDTRGVTPPDEDSTLDFLIRNGKIGLASMLDTGSKIAENALRPENMTPTQWHNAYRGSAIQDWAEGVKQRNARQYDPETETARYYGSMILQSLPETIADMGAGVAAGAAFGGVPGAIAGGLKGAFTAGKVGKKIYDAYNGAGKAAQLARRLTPTGNTAVTAGVSSLLEAKSEGQRAADEYIEDAKRNGSYIPDKTELEAQAIGDKVFNDNMAIITGANAAEYNLMFGKHGGGWKNRLGRVAASMAMEGGEETAQEAAALSELNKTMDERRLKDAAITGALMGGLFNVGGQALSYPTERRRAGIERERQEEQAAAERTARQAYRDQAEAEQNQADERLFTGRQAQPRSNETLNTNYFQKWSSRNGMDTSWDDNEVTNTRDFKPSMVSFLNDFGAAMSELGVKPIITGGADKYGHASGTYSHANGYKVDIDDKRIPEGSAAHQKMLEIAAQHGAEVVHEANNGHYDIVIRRDDSIYGNGNQQQSTPRQELKRATNASPVDEKADYIYGRLIQKNYDPVHAAAIVGNLLQEESSLDTTNTNEIGAHGIGQWYKDRLTDLKNFAAERGLDPDDLDTQIDFIDHELQGKENGALQQILKTDNLEDAAYAVRKYYERPGEHEANDANRINQAKAVFGRNQGRDFSGSYAQAQAQGQSYSNPTTQEQGRQSQENQEDQESQDNSYTKPLIDINDDSSSAVQDLIRQFMETKYNATEGAEAAENASLFEGMFDTNGNFKNTKKNRQYARDNFADELAEFAANIRGNREEGIGNREEGRRQSESIGNRAKGQGQSEKIEQAPTPNLDALKAKTVENTMLMPKRFRRAYEIGQEAVSKSAERRRIQGRAAAILADEIGVTFDPKLQKALLDGQEKAINRAREQLKTTGIYNLTAEQAFDKFVNRKVNREIEQNQQPSKQVNTADDEYLNNIFANNKAPAKAVQAAVAPVSEDKSERERQGRAIKVVARANEVELPAGVIKPLEEGATKAIERSQEILRDNGALPPIEGIKGRDTDVLTDSGKSNIKTQYRVVEADDLIDSDSANYPQELQPRDRNRKAMQQQVAQIANNPKAEGEERKSPKPSVNQNEVSTTTEVEEVKPQNKSNAIDDKTVDDFMNSWNQDMDFKEMLDTWNLFDQNGFINNKKNRDFVRKHYSDKLSGFANGQQQGVAEPIELSESEEQAQPTPKEETAKAVEEKVSRNLSSIAPKDMTPEELQQERERLEKVISDQRYSANMQAKSFNPASIVEAQTRINEIDMVQGKKVYPWQMTQEQAQKSKNIPAAKHKELVEKAVKEGKTIPDEVLAEYPELTKVSENSNATKFSDIDDKLPKGMRTKSWTPKGVSYVYERRKGKSPQTL